MTARTFRRIALGMSGAIESAHHGHPDFRANGKIFATLQAGDRGMVVLTPDQQATFVAGHPDAFIAESGAWGRQGCTRVILAAADEEAVGEAMTLAWQKASAARLRKNASARQALRKKPKARR